MYCYNKICENPVNIVKGAENPIGCNLLDESNLFLTNDKKAIIDAIDNSKSCYELSILLSTHFSSFVEGCNHEILIRDLAKKMAELGGGTVKFSCNYLDNDISGELTYDMDRKYVSSEFNSNYGETDKNGVCIKEENYNAYAITFEDERTIMESTLSLKGDKISAECRIEPLAIDFITGNFFAELSEFYRLKNNKEKVSTKNSHFTKKLVIS